MPATIDIDRREIEEAIETFNDMIASMDEKWVRSAQRRTANRHIIPAMKNKIHSTRLEDMIGVTTAKKNSVPPFGIRIGVVKNDPARFPDFSAQGLASVLEYGTEERFRTLRAAGIITGRQSTGEMKPHPALRPAWDGNVRSFMRDVEGQIEKRVTKA